MKVLILISILIILCIILPFLSGGIKEEVAQFRSLLAQKILKKIVMLILFLGIPVVIIFIIFLNIEASPDPRPPYDKEKASACIESGGGWIPSADEMTYWCDPNADFYMNEKGELVYLNEDQGRNNLIEVSSKSSTSSNLEYNSQFRSELKSCKKEIEENLLFKYKPNEEDMPENYVEPEITFHDDVFLEETSNTVLATYTATIYNVDWDFECTFEKTKESDNYKYKLSNVDNLNNGR